MRIHQINTKGFTEGGHGLQKQACELVRITENGLQGDHYYYRNSKENATDYAVSLLPLSVIVDLNKEDWPVEPGHLGENLTIDQCRMNDFSPGQLLSIGDVRLEITEQAKPCNKLAHLPYVGEEKVQKFIETLIDRRGWYAKVHSFGIIGKGYAVIDSTPSD